MKYNTDNFKQVMLNKETHRAYTNLVVKYKYLNKTTQVNHYLTQIFNRALKELELQAQSVGATFKTNISLHMNEAIEKFFYEFGRPESCSVDVKCRLKIPLSTIESIISRSFNIRGRDAINKHKKELMQHLKLTQIREGNNHFVVFQGFYDKDPLQLSLKEWLDPVIKKIHDVGELCLQEIEHMFDYDKRKLQTFRDVASEYQIAWNVVEGQIKYFSQVSGGMQIK